MVDKQGTVQFRPHEKKKPNIEKTKDTFRRFNLPYHYNLSHHLSCYKSIDAFPAQPLKL